jgi:2',3'-cyclic-nucleotide 2'-phosphodiesterase (5'-nucleotidase family)
MKSSSTRKFALAMFAFALSFSVLTSFAATAYSATLGRATAPFDNARPDRGETAWGRLVADSIRSAAGADIGLVHAAALQRGTLAAGEVTDAKVNALLAFPNDDVVTITITGAQLRAALERAVQAYPTGSSAFLHGSGFSAQFNTQAPTNERLTLLRINGKEVKDTDSIRAAMPQPLAQGGSGYFTIWNAEKAARSGTTVAAAIGNYIRARNEISPETTPRLAPQ